MTSLALILPTRRAAVGRHLGRACVALFLLLVAATGLGARAMTHFGPADPAWPGMRRHSLAMAGYLLRNGFCLPKPFNRRTPADVGLRFEREVLAAPGGPALEAWRIEAGPRPRGTVVLFHGHAGSKASTLQAAQQFHGLGFRTLLVDFRGSGGSSGDVTTIGWYEADDVAAGLAHARALGRGPVVVYGASMGAAAALKAAHDGARPEALVLECPYDSLRTTVLHRVDRFGVPAGPLADLMLLWGGWQLGFDAYRLNPVEFAAGVRVPTYLGFGEKDPWVRPDEARRIYAALAGPKRMRVFGGAGHGAYADLRPDAWRADVEAFLRSEGI